MLTSQAMHSSCLCDIVHIKYPSLDCHLLLINHFQHFEHPHFWGGKQAFSTCSAHLTVVIVFFRTILFMHLKPKSKETLNSDNMDATDKLITVFYGLMTPMMESALILQSQKQGCEGSSNTSICGSFVSKWMESIGLETCGTV